MYDVLLADYATEVSLSGERDLLTIISPASLAGTTQQILSCTSMCANNCALAVPSLS